MDPSTLREESCACGARLFVCLAIPYDAGTGRGAASPFAVKSAYPIHPSHRTTTPTATEVRLPITKVPRATTAAAMRSKPAHRGNTPARVVAIPSSTPPTPISELATWIDTPTAGLTNHWAYT